MIYQILFMTVHFCTAQIHVSLFCHIRHATFKNLLFHKKKHLKPPNILLQEKEPSVSSAFAARCQPLLQPEQWTISLVSDEHGEQNETTQEQSPINKPQLTNKLSLPVDFYQKLEVELPPLHVPSRQATKTLLTVEDIESLSADIYPPVYTFMRSAEVHHNMANTEAHLQETPSSPPQEPVGTDTDTESIDTDLGALLAYGNLGPVSVDEISVEALPSDTNMESLLNDTYQFGNVIMRDAKHQPNTSEPLVVHLQSRASSSDTTNEKVPNVDGKRVGNKARWGSACEQSFGSVRTNSDKSIVQSSENTVQKPFQCDMCLKQFVTSNDYQRHRGIHFGNKLFTCDFCRKEFNDRSNYRKHKRTHTGEKPFKCDMCHEQFRTSSAQKVHRRIHTGEKPFQCDLCTKHFRTSGDYQRHRRTHTGEKPFQCDICAKQWGTSSDCKTHRRTHTGEKPFQCDICTKQFRTSGVYQRHRRTHTGEKPFECDICAKRSCTSGDCETHRRTHTGEKPFQCDICAKRFRTSWNCKTHRRIHTGEKPFQCDICTKLFRTSSDYHKHRLIHTGKKSYICYWCNQDYCSKRNLIGHLRRCSSRNVSYTADPVVSCFINSGARLWTYMQ